MNINPDWPVVELTKQEIQKIQQWCLEMVATKADEFGYRRDNDSILARHFTGRAGEVAVQNHTGQEFVDWSIGDSSLYNYPDMGDVGVKTSVFPNHPVIFKTSKYPEIICLKAGRNIHRVAICGLATPDLLNKYQNDSLILSSKLRAKGTKTAFTGMEFCKPLHHEKEPE